MPKLRDTVCTLSYIRLIQRYRDIVAQILPSWAQAGRNTAVSIPKQSALVIHSTEDESHAAKANHRLLPSSHCIPSNQSFIVSIKASPARDTSSIPSP